MTSASLVRLPVSAAAALGVTFGLFLFIHQLISSGSSERVMLEPISGIHFGPVEIPDEITRRTRHRPPEPPPPSRPPPSPRMEIDAIDQSLQPLQQMDIPQLDIPLGPGEGIFIGNLRQVDVAAEGDVVPVVVIRPIYPREASIRGIEGWVKVEFTITETGTVKRPRVIDADPPRVFNREALRAILKWKFKPRVVDGVAVERLATQVIEFSLDES